jgi:hypothetical protein
MHLSFNKNGDEFHFIIHNDKGKELGNAFASLSNNSQFWKLEGICIPEEKDRGKGSGSDLLNYVREQLWEKQKLPIRVHAGVSPDAVVSERTAEDTKRFYRKNGFQDEGDGKHLVDSPQGMSV